MKQFIAKLILPVFLCLGIAGCGPSEMTSKEASDMFSKVGGVQAVNQEAKTLLDQIGTNSVILMGPDLTNYPALSGLGTVMIPFASPGFSTHIEIPFGSHRDRHFIFILKPDAPIEFPLASHCIQVTTNIFVSRW